MLEKMKTHFANFKRTTSAFGLGWVAICLLIPQFAQAQSNLYQVRTASGATGSYAVNWKKSAIAQKTERNLKTKVAKKSKVQALENAQEADSMAMPMAPESVLSQEHGFAWVAPNFLDSLVEAAVYELPDPIAPMQVLNPSASFKWVGMRQETKTAGMFAQLLQ